MAVPTTRDMFRPTDPDFLADPYPTYALLRREAPIAYYEGWGRWIVTRYRDVDRLLRDRRLGRVIHHRLHPTELPASDPAHAPFHEIQRGSLLEIEPPDHTRVRTVVHAVFTPKHVRGMRERIERLVDELVDALEARRPREADLLRDFAEPLPLTVIAELLGVPLEERGPLLGWSKAIIGMFEPERTAAMEAAAVRAAGEFAAYVRTLIARARSEGTSGLVARMVAAHDADPASIGEDEIVANAILFLNAGHEAVVNVIGNGMLALLRRPDVREEVRADPVLVPGAVEEMMRFDTPLQFFERFVLEDMEYGGHAWPKGTRLCLSYASANHDPDVFPNPGRFDPRRDPNPHLAFGLGVHYCIGAPLARMELAAAVGTLLARLPELRLRPARLQYQPRNVFRYLVALPVAY